MEFSGESKDIPGRDERECDVSIIEWRLPKKGKVSGWESIAHILLLKPGEESNVGETPTRQLLIPLIPLTII